MGILMLARGHRVHHSDARHPGIQRASAAAVGNWKPFPPRTGMGPTAPSGMRTTSPLDFAMKLGMRAELSSGSGKLTEPSSVLHDMRPWGSV
jgi:hypothetical protein